MEYKINNFNLADITFKDLKSLSDHFEKGLFAQKIQNILVGPNVINIKYSKENREKVEENKKIMNSICRLLLYNSPAKAEQAFILYSNSNLSSKSYIKSIFKELDNLLGEKSNKNDMINSIACFEFLSIFTAFKDNNFDEVTICDYIMHFIYDETIKFSLLETIQENHSYITNKNKNFNNVNIFYMILYNLSIDELKFYFLCDKTKEFFAILEKNNEIDTFIKRYFFINQFKILKNTSKYDENAKSNENVMEIKREYDFYHNLYNSYIKLKKILGIDEENEKKIFDIFSAILLLTEYEYMDDEIAKRVLEKIKLNKESLDILQTLQSVIFSDYKLNLKSKINIKSNEIVPILHKISWLLNISEEKIVLILLTDLQNEKLSYNKATIQKMKENFIKVLYKIFISKLKTNFNKNFQSAQSKISFYISRTNLLFNQIHIEQNNYTVHNNETLYIIDKNLKENLMCNYEQDLKNFYYISNSLNITSTIREFSWPTILYNENFIQKIINEQYSFDAILAPFEEPNFGIIKIFEEPGLLASFKQHFNTIGRKNVVELIEMKYLKIKHSFGTVLYDLNELQKQLNSLKKYHFFEDLIQKFLELKENRKNIISNYDTGIKYLKRLSNQVVYINLLIKHGKFPNLNVIEDLKIHNIYYFYSNFFNFIVNMKEIRMILMKNNKLTKSMPKDDFIFFKRYIAKKIKFSHLDYFFENGYVYCRVNFNRILDDNRNIANLIFKYNHKMFYHFTAKKIETSNFSYLRYSIRAVFAYLKLIKIYREKKIFRLIKNILLDAIVENYQLATEIDKEEELKMDFKGANLSKILPKLLSYLVQFKKIWRNYLSDIFYLEKNKVTFLNVENTEKLVEDRMINLKILLYLFSKKYQFININVLRKVGILHHEFIKKVTSEISEHFIKIYLEMREFIKEYNITIQDSSLTFENLFIKNLPHVSFLTNNPNFEKIRKNSLTNNSNRKLSNENIGNVNSTTLRSNIDRNIKNNEEDNNKSVRKTHDNYDINSSDDEDDPNDKNQSNNNIFKTYTEQISDVKNQENETEDKNSLNQQGIYSKTSNIESIGLDNKTNNKSKLIQRTQVKLSEDNGSKSDDFKGKSIENNFLSNNNDKKLPQEISEETKKESFNKQLESINKTDFNKSITNNNLEKGSKTDEHDNLQVNLFLNKDDSKSSDNTLNTKRVIKNKKHSSQSDNLDEQIVMDNKSDNSNSQIFLKSKFEKPKDSTSINNILFSS